MGDVYSTRCPQCWSGVGDKCRRKVFGVGTFSTPCAIRGVIAEREEGCPADQQRLGNDQLVNLYLAAGRARSPQAKKEAWGRYRQLVRKPRVHSRRPPLKTAPYCAVYRPERRKSETVDPKVNLKATQGIAPRNKVVSSGEGLMCAPESG